MVSGGTTLLRLVKFPVSPALENAEKLEQLRALDNSIPIASCAWIMTDQRGPEDVARRKFCAGQSDWEIDRFRGRRQSFS